MKLGLSENAARQRLSPSFKTGILNRLIEHPRFSELLRLIDVYFSGAVTDGVMARNELLGSAHSILTEYRKSHPDQASEVRDGVTSSTTGQ